jgi:hypothetical protein
MDAVDRGDKAITPTGQGFDKPRIVGGVAESIPQPFDGGIQAVLEVDEGVGRPKAGLEFLASNQFTGFFQQKIENLQRLVL